MKVKKKNYIIILICMFIFACLLSCGIFALADSVKFKLGINLKPSVYFALSINIDNAGEQFIFDNRTTGANPVEDWATVKNLTLTLENDALSTAQNVELKVYNYNASKLMSFEVYDTAGGVISTNYPNGLKNIDESASLILNPNAITEAEYSFKIKAEIYDEAIPQYSVRINNVDSCPAYLNCAYTNFIKSTKTNEQLSIKRVLINNVIFTNFSYNGATGEFVINENLINGDIDIYTTGLYYNLVLNLVNCSATYDNITYSDKSTSVIYNISKSSDLNINIIPESAEFQSWLFLINIDGSQLASSNYLYNDKTQTLTISNEHLEDNISISATASLYWTGQTATQFDSGSGTENDPFLIKNGEELSYLQSIMTDSEIDVYSNGTKYTIPAYGENTYFALKNDIYLNKNYQNYQTWTNASNLKQIQSVLTFNGNFNGNFAKIVGYFSSRALFVTLNGYLCNLGLTHGYIYSSYSTSALVHNNYGSIEYCYNSCNIFAINTTGNYAACGGIVAWDWGNIFNCYNTGNIILTSTYREQYVGGVTAVKGAGNLTNCYNTGLISGNEYSWIGGIVGDAGRDATSNNNINIDYCYNVGEISSGQYSGKIVGSAYTAKIQTSNCYFTSGVACGLNRGTATNNFLISTTELQNQNNLQNFDFANTWTYIQGQNGGFPVLKGFY